MALADSALVLLIGGVETIDFLSSASSGGDGYNVGTGTLLLLNEPNIAATYTEAEGRHGSALASRRFENRVVNFSLKIVRTGSTSMDDVQADRNVIADALDAARRYALAETPGTTIGEGEVVLKYKRAYGSMADYARVIGGAIGSNPQEHSAFTQYKVGSTITTEFAVPVSLVLEPFWRPERDLYFRNCLLNGGFEAGVTGGGPATPNGWAVSTTGTITADYNTYGAFVRSGTTSHYQNISASTTAGSIKTAQTFTLASVGLSAGQTVWVSAWLWIQNRTTGAGHTLTVEPLDGGVSVLTTGTATATSAAGAWQRLDAVLDLPPTTTQVRVTLITSVSAGGNTALAFWDEVQAQPHADNLLNGGTFSRVTGGIGDYWGGTAAGVAATPTATSSAAYDGFAQQVAITSGTGTYAVSQDVTLTTHNVKAGDLLTFGAWIAVPARVGTAVAYATLAFRDGNNLILTTTTSETTSASGYVWVSAAAVVPYGATVARAALVADTGGGAQTITARFDNATLYRGHSDQSARRFWPWSRPDGAYLPAWFGGARLTSDPSAVDGKQIGLAHSGLPGNVPGPTRILVGCSDEVPNPVIVAYKRDSTRVVAYSNVTNATNLSAEVGSNTADAAAITSNYRLWTPTTTTETPLLNWDGADTPPGRYLIVLRVKLTTAAHYSRYSFRAAIRLNNTNTSAGTWSQILHAAPPWVGSSSSGYELWPIGVIPMPLRSRLPAYVNSSRFEVSGRVSDAAGTSARIDGAYFLPIDGYFKGEKSYYHAELSSPGTSSYFTVLIDSITPLPGGLTAYTNGNFPTYLPSTFDDQPDAEEVPIALGETGQLFVLHAGTAHVKTYTETVGVFYRPLFSTAGVVS